MLDTLTEPVPLDRLAIGVARDIRRRISTEDRVFDHAANSLLAPIYDRLRRYPTRSLRPQMLADLVNDWHAIPAIEWRLWCRAELEKARCSITERRLAAGTLQRKDWEADEPDVAVIEVAVQIDRNTMKLHTRCLCTFSIHALARRLQRHPDAGDSSLIFDIGLAADAAAGELTAGAGYKVTTDPVSGGGWRGRATRQKQPNGESYVVLSVRTWL